MPPSKPREARCSSTTSCRPPAAPKPLRARPARTWPCRRYATRVGHRCCNWLFSKCERIASSSARNCGPRPVGKASCTPARWPKRSARLRPEPPPPKSRQTPATGWCNDRPRSRNLRSSAHVATAGAASMRGKRVWTSTGLTSTAERVPVATSQTRRPEATTATCAPTMRPASLSSRRRRTMRNSRAVSASGRTSWQEVACNGVPCTKVAADASTSAARACRAQTARIATPSTSRETAMPRRMPMVRRRKSTTPGHSSTSFLAGCSSFSLPLSFS
mmetsp:Transcript_75530/g.244371  ORF Transcript_75530/g.244371 Transcript_75530/m.244371 type:complete len:275 (-) Transcript_75530:406-1230(-)